MATILEELTKFRGVLEDIDNDLTCFCAKTELMHTMAELIAYHKEQLDAAVTDLRMGDTLYIADTLTVLREIVRLMVIDYKQRGGK